jgi:hypothetical protein
MSKENINNGKKDEEKRGDEVISTETPEEILATLQQGQDLREQLTGRLGALKDILSNIEKRAGETPILADEVPAILSLSEVEKSIMIIQIISSDLQNIIINIPKHMDDGVNGDNAIEALGKIIKIYDSVIDKLGK